MSIRYMHITSKLFKLPLVFFFINDLLFFPYLSIVLFICSYFLFHFPISFVCSLLSFLPLNKSFTMFLPFLPLCLLFTKFLLLFFVHWHLEKHLSTSIISFLSFYVSSTPILQHFFNFLFLYCLIFCPLKTYALCP